MAIRIEPGISIRRGDGYAAAEEEYDANITSFLEQKLAEGTTMFPIRSWINDDVNNDKTFDFKFTAPCDLYIADFQIGDYVAFDWALHTFNKDVMIINVPPLNASVQAKQFTSTRVMFVKKGEVFSDYIYIERVDAVITANEAYIVMFTGTPYLARVGGGVSRKFSPFICSLPRQGGLHRWPAA